MKYLLLFSILLSMSAYAQDSEPLLKTFQMLNEINGKTFNYKACASDDPNAPEYCKDLYNYICSQTKTTNKKGNLDTSLNNQYWQNLSKTPTYKQFNDTVKATHEISEENVYTLTGMTRTDIRNAVSDVKTAMTRFINSTSLINNEYKTPLIQSTSAVELVYGKEYVEKLVQYAKKNVPNMAEEQIRAQANQLYMSACGMNGLEVNAFYEGGNLVLCPGLLISVSDYGKSKDEVIASLRFTIGHEIGHAIDTAAYPNIYNKMKTCYQNVTNNQNIWTAEMSGEITADYWGALALGAEVPGMKTKKLNPDDPEVNARIIALSVDGFCTAPVENSLHPASSFRVNQIMAKHPYLARALNCAPAKGEAPYCSINGAYSN